MSRFDTSSACTRAASWSLEPVTPRMGMRIKGLALDRATDADARLAAALLDEHGFLVLHDQRLTPHALAAFGRQLGRLDQPPVNENGRTAVPGVPEIYVVSNVRGPDGRPLGSLGAGEAAWHTDMSYLPIPPDASALYAVEVPPSGGNTWIAGMGDALDSLPAGLRRRIEGRRIKHDGAYNSAGLRRQGVALQADPRRSPGALHPAICPHPRTGREMLYLGRRQHAYVDGLDPHASTILLDELWAHAVQPRFCYEHVWRPGDVLLWDNRATLHRRDPFDAAARRYMLRIQVRGTVGPGERDTGEWP